MRFPSTSDAIAALAFTATVHAQQAKSVPEGACAFKTCNPLIQGTIVKNYKLDFGAQPYLDPDFNLDYDTNHEFTNTYDADVDTEGTVPSYVFQYRCTYENITDGWVCNNPHPSADGKLECTENYKCLNDYGPQTIPRGGSYFESSNLIREWTGYLLAQKTETITVTLNRCDDYAAFWFGNGSAFQCGNEDAHDSSYGQPLLTCSDNSPSVQIPVEAGFFYPFRIVYVNSKDNGAFTFTPDGSDGTWLGPNIYRHLSDDTCAKSSSSSSPSSSSLTSSSAVTSAISSSVVTSPVSSSVVSSAVSSAVSSSVVTSPFSSSVVTSPFSSSVVTSPFSSSVVSSAVSSSVVTSPFSSSVVTSAVSLSVVTATVEKSYLSVATITQEAVKTVTINGVVTTVAANDNADYGNAERGADQASGSDDNSGSPNNNQPQEPASDNNEGSNDNSGASGDKQQQGSTPSNNGASGDKQQQGSTPSNNGASGNKQQQGSTPSNNGASGDKQQQGSTPSNNDAKQGNNANNVATPAKGGSMAATFKTPKPTAVAQATRGGSMAATFKVPKATATIQQVNNAFRNVINANLGLLGVAAFLL